MSTIMVSIPKDILHMEILPWLSYKTLSKLSSVSKEWYHLIYHDSVFMHQHSYRHGSLGFMCVRDHNVDFVPINMFGKLNIYEPETSFSSFPDGTGCARIVASTNGLLLLLLKTRWENHNLFNNSTFHYIWNPVTKEGHAIPESHTRNNEYIGLAYEPLASPTHYKLVKLIVDNLIKFKKFEFKIYLSDMRKWITYDQRLVIQVQCSMCWWNVLYIRGIIYWNCDPYIIWFDLDKNISDYMLPPIEQFKYFQYLGVTDEEILTNTQQLYNNSFLIWMMAKEGEWVKRYHLDSINIMDDSYFLPLPFMGGNKFYIEMTIKGKNMLCYYQMATKEIIEISELENHRFLTPCQYTLLNYNSNR
ncbi:hypothetical protein MUK42_35341 [Musa troglodytarum]|uniref:F-box associated beta-propeller type 1 domain-containing protein n=1 Tax=Musa troglodytarum TaxID=320322 RepID=A0A9E7GCB7_9LILI|nr:hypothetical protein MUK42_35341 [Musa troglodytarum]